MAVLCVYNAKGDPKELLKKYDKAKADFSDAKNHQGAIFHICLETPDGIQIINLLNSEKDMNRLINDQSLGQTIERVGLSSAAVNHQFQTFPVHYYQAV